MDRINMPLLTLLKYHGKRLGFLRVVLWVSLVFLGMAKLLALPNYVILVSKLLPP